MVAHSSKFPNLETTIFTKMSLLAQQHGALNLAQGFPDFPPERKVIDALKNAAESGFQQYAPMAGHLPLREKIAEKVERLYGKKVEAKSEITITAGGTQAIFSAITALVCAGDEVILFAPAYDSYAPAIELVGGKAIYYSLSAPDFTIDWDMFAALLSPKTKLILVNTPHNPTGTVFTKVEWEALAKMVHNKPIFILSDEVYEHMVFDGKTHHSILSVESLFDRTIAVFSFGKTYHVTGWKVGYIVAPAQITKEIQKLHQYTVFSVNTLAQVALCEILDAPNLYATLPNFYQQKRDFFQAEMAQSRFVILPCASTYFQLANFAQISEKGDVEFCNWLTKEVGVAAIPTSVFYADGRDQKLIRFCFAREEKVLKKAAEWLSKI